MAQHEDGSVADSAVRRVLYVAKTHLDVGFTATARQVRQRYLDDFFPRAIRVAAELRDSEPTARLRWTTGSWILTEALEAADPSHRRRLEEAIEQGALSWHALPFTLHTEYCGRSLVAHGLSLSAELDRRFGRHTRAAKATDVPGHTRGLVSVLDEAGVDFLHVGVNPAAAAPKVPERFRWRHGDAALAVMYQPGGYGDVQVIDDTGVAVCIDLTGDNLGPRSADEVVAAFRVLAERFPGAEVRAATLDDVAAAMADAGSTLPVLDAEIGDSWIHGVASDPQKTAGFRALSRLRQDWIVSGRVPAEDPALRRASTQLLSVAEHTWGLDQKTHWAETDHWSVAGLASVRSRPDTVRFEASWAEQRALLDRVADELRDGGRAALADEAAATLASLVPSAPITDGLRRSDPASPVHVGGFEVRLDPDNGSIIGLVGADGHRWASPEHPIGGFHQRTYDAADYERWFSTYNAGTLPEDEGWARWDNTKPGLATSGAVSRRWPTSLRELWCGTDATGEVVVMRLSVDAEPADPVAPARSIWMSMREGQPAGALDFELTWIDKAAARWPESSWWTFAPVVDDATQWTMDKLGERVSPLDVVEGGGRRLHIADRLDHPDGVGIELLDSGAVAPGAPELLVWDDAPVDLLGGWHLCLHANLWGTNFPMWTEGSARFRVQVTLGEPHRPRAGSGNDDLELERSGVTATALWATDATGVDAATLGALDGAVQVADRARRHDVEHGAGGRGQTVQRRCGVAPAIQHAQLQRGLVGDGHVRGSVRCAGRPGHDVVAVARDGGVAGRSGSGADDRATQRCGSAGADHDRGAVRGDGGCLGGERPVDGQRAGRPAAVDRAVDQLQGGAGAEGDRPGRAGRPVQPEAGRDEGGLATAGIHAAEAHADADEAGSGDVGRDVDRAVRRLDVEQ